MIGRIFQVWFLLSVACLVLFWFAMYVGDRLEEARKEQTKRVDP